ncbi:MAG TPA: hypothetical protein VKR27_03575, partial [Acidimicrobiales bacterium]|nr:hypothetical protein [Acidimicrobiales bacterium]
MESEAPSERIEEATRHSDLGLQSGFKGVLGLPRRVMARMLWPLLREQVEFNHQMIDLLRYLTEQASSLYEQANFFRRAYDNFEQAFDNVDDA